MPSPDSQANSGLMSVRNTDQEMCPIARATHDSVWQE